jgi:hypothetical protein
MSDDAPTKPPSRANSVLEFANAHFLLVSGIALFLGAITATVFLYGYVSVFDWRLIWIVDYQDILKVGLVAIAILSGFAFTIGVIVDAAFVGADVKAETEQQRQAARRLRTTSFFVGLGFLGLMLAVHLGLTATLIDDPKYGFIVMLYLALTMLFMVVYYAIDRAREPSSATPRALLADFFFFVIAIAALGAAFGNHAKERQGFYRDVYTRDAAYREVGLIMITSRYVALFRDGHSLICLWVR